MSELMVAWSELLDLLGSHTPLSREQIRSGDADGPGLIEQTLDITLSTELREWFIVQGGTEMSWDAMFLPEAIPLSAREAAGDSRLIYALWSENGKQDATPRGSAGEPAYTWLAEYVMVGADGCGGGFFVDTRPGPAQGCVRWWDKTESDNDYGDGPAAPSLAALIRAVAASLRDGRIVFQDRAWLAPRMAVARDGRLEWLDPRDS